MLRKKNKIRQRIILMLLFSMFFIFTAEKSFAQQSLSTLDNYLSTNNLTYSSMSYDEKFLELVKAERARLAGNFEPEILKYLGKDMAKHYWMDIFIENEGYFKGAGQADLIAHKIRIQAIRLPIDKGDFNSLGMKYTLMREIAFDMNFAGQREQAVEIKKQAEQIIKDNEELNGRIGAAEEFLLCVYDNLETDPGICKKNNP